MSDQPSQPDRPASRGVDPGAAPTSAGGSGGLGSKRDRDLIEAAIQDQTPFEAAIGMEGDLPAADTFPGYDLMREIHRGGQGVVYLALQRATKRRVAIKVMHSGPFIGSKGRARFEREVQILGQLNHPNIVRIHDSGVTRDGSFFYVMDYISGRTLSEHMQTKKLELNEMLRLFAKICHGVNAAHLKGVIHRDLKPANVRVDQTGEPIIVDFGLAKVAVPEAIQPGESAQDVMSMTGQFIGSLPWASPEQAEGAHGNIDVRTDVYSLGVMFYQMLTGRFPYEVIGSMRDVLDRILRSEPVKPSTVRRAIGDEIETIVLKCLRKERERRYQSAGDLARDIERYMQGQPVEAKSDSGWYVISKTLRRYRMPVGVGVGFLLTVVAFGVVMAVLYKQKSIAEREASASALVANEQKLVAQESADIAVDLAKSMLYDFPPAIEKLVGSTQARRTLLTTLEAQITRLKERRPADRGLVRMLADSHELAGDLKSGLSMQSTGTLDQAESHYDQCLEIREQLAAAEPGPEADAALGRVRVRKASVRLSRQDFAGAEALAREAVAKFESAVAKAAPEHLAEYRLARLEAMVRIADAVMRRSEKGDPAGTLPAIEAALAEYERLAPEFRAMLEEDGANTKAARWVGVMHDKRASALMSAAARLRVEGAKKNSAEAGSGDAMLASALDLTRRARESSLAAGKELTALSEAYPRNGELKRDLWLAHYMAGSAAAEGARVHGARKEADPAKAAWSLSREDMDRALAIARELLAGDPVNLEARRDVTGVLLRRGNAWRELGLVAAGAERETMLASAIADFTECLESREVIWATDPMQQHRRDLAAALFKVGEVALLTGDRARARACAERSRGELQALVTEGAMTSENGELREAADLLRRATMAP